MTGQVEDLPYAHQTIDLDPNVRDAWGLPAPRLTYDWRRPNERARLEFISRKMEEIGRAMGATHVWRNPEAPAPGRAHEGGTRMGSDPKSSVVNRYGQSWDIPNLFVVGSSTFPSQSGFNPTLTIQALAYMTADAIVEPLPEEPWTTRIAASRTRIANQLDRHPIAVACGRGLRVHLAGPDELDRPGHAGEINLNLTGDQIEERGPPPRYGTCCMSTPAIILNSLPVTLTTQASNAGCVEGRRRSFHHLFEISHVRRRLVLLGRHQEAVRAQEIGLLADHNVIVADAANILHPVGVLGER